MKNRISTLTLAVIAVLAFSACGSDSKTAATVAPTVTAEQPTITVVTPTTAAPTTIPATTVPPTTVPPATVPPATAAPTTSEVPTTTQAPVTTEAPTTTAAPLSGNVGVVWASQVDPARVNAQGQPTFEDLGVTARIDLMLWVPTDGHGDLASECRQSVKFNHDYNGAPDTADHCLIVQWAFDVAPDLKSEDGSVTAGPMLTPDGLQIDGIGSQNGLPGAKNRGLTVAYAGGTPGSTLQFTIGTGKPGYDSVDHTVTVPSIEEMMPIDF